jgi:hypothetical protein
MGLTKLNPICYNNIIKRKKRGIPNMKNIMRLTISVSNTTIDLVDRMTGEIYTSGPEHINEMLKLFEYEGTAYDIRIESRRSETKFGF